MDDKNNAGNDKKRRIAKRRAPWHITLLTGAVWFLLCGGLRIQVIVVSGAMMAFGLLYLAWPHLGRGPEGPQDGDGGPDL